MRTSLALAVLGCCLLAGAPSLRTHHHHHHHHHHPPPRPARALSQPAARCIARALTALTPACACAHKHPHAAEHAGAHASHSRQLHAATDEQIIALFPAWNASLQTKDPLKVADMYTADGMLLPTVSNKVRGRGGGGPAQGWAGGAAVSPTWRLRLYKLFAATPGMRHASCGTHPAARITS
jgi:hypothetical protein